MRTPHSPTGRHRAQHLQRFVAKLVSENTSPSECVYPEPEIGWAFDHHDWRWYRTTSHGFQTMDEDNNWDQDQWFEDQLAAYESCLDSNEPPKTIYAHVHLESMIELNFPGPANCEHVKITKFSGGTFMWRGHVYRSERFPFGLISTDYFVTDPNPNLGLPTKGRNVVVPHIVDRLRRYLEEIQDSLNWESLPSSSEFGLMQFLAEIDDTIAQFSVGFLKKLFSFKDGWGSFEWGIMPFVGDIMSLVNAYKKRNEDMSYFPIESNYTKRTPVRYGLQVGEVLIRHTGFASSLADPYLEFLDRIGLHFDISVVWDLIPLSFVIDYLFPVGDILSSFNNGGWVRTVEFEGWTVMSGTFKVDSLDNAHYYFLTIDDVTECSFFYRRYHKDVLHVPYVDSADGDVSFIELPSIKQLWNMFYIFFS